MKKVIFSLILISCFVGLIFADVEKNRDKKEKNFYFFIGGEWGISAFSPVVVYSLPLYVRDVPIHKEDTWWTNKNNIAPIPDKKNKYWFIPLRISGIIGFGYRNGLYDFRFGPIVRWNFASGSSVIKRNYTNAPGTEQRGYGAALTYYGFTMSYMDGWRAVSPGIFLRLSRNMQNKKNTSEINEKINLFIEYSAYSFSLDIENGWDRYDCNQRWQIYNLARGYQHSILFGHNTEDIADVYVGYIFNNLKLSRTGLESDLKISHGVVFGLRYRLAFKKHF